MIATAVRIYHVLVGDVVLSAAVEDAGDPFVGEVVCLGLRLPEGVWVTVEAIEADVVYCRCHAAGIFAEETAIKDLVGYGYLKTFSQKSGKWAKAN